MAKLTKNRKISIEKVDSEKAYSVEEASSLVKEITTTKFDSSVDLAVRLGVDPKKANEMVRGVVSLPTISFAFFGSTPSLTAKKWLEV